MFRAEVQLHGVRAYLSDGPTQWVSPLVSTREVRKTGQKPRHFHFPKKNQRESPGQTLKFLTR